MPRFAAIELNHWHSYDRTRVQAASMLMPCWWPQAYCDQLGRGANARDGHSALIARAILAKGGT